MPAAMDPVAERRFSIALDDHVVPSATSGARLDEATACRIADDVSDLLAEVLSGGRRPRSPEFLRDAFLQDAARIAVEEGIELSEEDWTQLLHEAIALEVSLKASEQIRGSFENIRAGVTLTRTEWAGRRRS